MAFGVLMVLLSNYAKFFLKLKINKYLDAVNVLRLENENIEVINQFPEQLVIRKISRQNRLKETKSRSLVPGSELIECTFSQLVLKSVNNILCIRGSLDAASDSVISEFLTIGGAEIEDDKVEVDLISFEKSEDAARIYSIVKASFQSFKLSLLWEDIRLLLEVEMGENGGLTIPVSAPRYKFKTLDGITLMYLDLHEDNLVRRLAHLQLQCSRVCCLNPAGEKMTRVEHQNRMIQEMNVIIHGKQVSNNHHSYFRDQRIVREEKDYVQNVERNWQDGVPEAKNFGRETQQKQEKVFQSLKPGPLATLIKKPEEDLLSEERRLQLLMKKKKKEAAKKIAITRKGAKGRVKSSDYGKIRKKRNTESESDPDWLPDFEGESSSESISDEGEEDVKLLLEEAKQPLVELLKGVQMDLYSVKAADLANGYVKISKLVQEKKMSEKEAFEEMRKLRARLDREYGSRGGGKKSSGEVSPRSEEASWGIGGGSLTSGGVDSEDRKAEEERRKEYWDQEAAEIKKMGIIVDELDKKRNDPAAETLPMAVEAEKEKNPGLFSRFFGGTEARQEDVSNRLQRSHSSEN